MSLELEAKERFRFYNLNPEAKEKVLEALKKKLSELGDVTLAVVYGSFIKNYPFRDIDISVYIVGKCDYLDKKLELDTMLSELVNYPVDVRILNEAPPWFTKKVLEEGRVLVEKTPYLTERLYLKAVNEDALKKTCV